MKYRGLTWDEKTGHRWVHGMPSYDYAGRITEIETERNFYPIIPFSLGKETEYEDKNWQRVYTEDIVTLEVNGEVKELEVVETTVDREYYDPDGFGIVKNRLSGVIAFRERTASGEVYDLLPCVDDKGVVDTCRMEIVDTVAERKVRERESEGKEQ